MTPEDERALLLARARTAALCEERRRMAAERRRALGMPVAEAAAPGRLRPWALLIPIALAALMAGTLVLMHG